MARITNADQVLLLLRAQLERADKLKRRATTRTPSGETPKQSAVERLRAVVADKDIPEDQLHRALISALLVEDFGEEALNQPLFQNLVSRVTETIMKDKDTKALLQRAVRTLGEKQ